MARAGRDRKIRLLGGVRLFSACSDQELRTLARLITEVQVPADRVLTREGQRGHEFFLIVEGTAKVSVRGRRRATLGAGDFFGEMALLDAGPRTATVTAQEPMTLYVLDAREFASMIQQSPSVARKIMRALAARLREAERELTH